MNVASGIASLFRSSDEILGALSSETNFTYPKLPAKKLRCSAPLRFFRFPFQEAHATSYLTLLLVIKEKGIFSSQVRFSYTTFQTSSIVVPSIFPVITPLSLALQPLSRSFSPRSRLPGVVSYLHLSSVSISSLHCLDVFALSDILVGIDSFSWVGAGLLKFYVKRCWF